MEESQILSNACVENGSILSEGFQKNDFDQTYIITDLSNSSQRLLSIPNDEGFHSNLLDQNKQPFVSNNSQDPVYEIPIVSNEIPVLNNFQTTFIDPTKDIADPITAENTVSFSVVNTPSDDHNSPSDDHNTPSANQCMTNLTNVNNLTELKDVKKLKNEEENSTANTQPAPQIQKKVFKLPFPIPKGLKKIKNLIAIYHCKLCGFLSKSKDLMDEHGKTHKVENDSKPQAKKPRRKRRTKKEKALKKEKKQRKTKKEKGPNKETDTDQDVKKEKAVKKEKSENEPKKKRGPRKPKEDILMKDGNVYCPECSFFTKNMQSLKVHRLMHLKERPYKCTICDYHGKDLKDLIRHHDAGHMPGVFVCKDCGYLTNERSRFDSHRETHTGHLPYRCKVCPYKTMLKAAHRIHMETHGIQV